MGHVIYHQEAADKENPSVQTNQGCGDSGIRYGLDIFLLVPQLAISASGLAYSQNGQVLYTDGLIILIIQWWCYAPHVHRSAPCGRCYTSIIILVRCKWPWSWPYLCQFWWYIHNWFCGSSPSTQEGMLYRHIINTWGIFWALNSTEVVFSYGAYQKADDGLCARGGYNFLEVMSECSCGSQASSWHMKTSRCVVAFCRQCPGWGQ